MAQLVFLLITFGLMWFILIRPQQQRVRRQQDLVRSLEVGDEVVTAGGIFGRVVGLDAEVARIEVAPGVEMRILRVAVNARVGEEGMPAVGSGPGGETAEATDSNEPVDGGSR
jgi:preprotein translocase subunit YajC